MQSKQKRTPDPVIKRLERVDTLLWHLYIEEQIQAGIAAAIQSKEGK